MSSPIIERARQDLDAAERAVAAAIKERDLCRAVVERLKEYEAEAMPTARTGEPELKPVPYSLLLEKLVRAGQPILIDDLMAKLAEIGRTPSGKNPKGNIASVLSKAKDRFEYQKDRGWRLKQNAPPNGEAS